MLTHTDTYTATHEFLRNNYIYSLRNISFDIMTMPYLSEGILALQLPIPTTQGSQL